MKQRCQNPNSPDYKWYGKLGVMVCSRWQSFANFKADMGERPPGTSLDRNPNSTGDYEPGNCRWATAAQQQQSKRNSKLSEVAAGQIRWLCSDGGLSQRTVAQAFEVHPSMVSRIVSNQYWR